MRFMVFVKGNSDSEAGKLPSAQEIAEMGVFNQELIDAGMVLGMEGLKNTASGTRIRYANGKTSVVDGPFAEAKEVIAGYWLLSAKSKDDVLDWLKRAPCFDGGGELEIRPLYEADDFGGDPNAPAPPQAPAKPNTRRYLLSLFADRFTEAEPDLKAPGTQKLMEEMGGLIGEIAGQGALIMADGLKPSSQSAKLQFDGKNRRVVDGPFTESKELVAGFTVVRATSQEEAVDWARRMLVIHCQGVGAAEGQIEVRPIFETADFPVDASEKPGGWRDQENAFRERTGQA
jgi:hypothetical protein